MFFLFPLQFGDRLFIATELVEGEGASTHTVVLRFESKDKAREIYESGEYQAIIGQRHGATSNHFAVLVDGLG